MRKQRRKWYEWLADLTGYKAKVDQQRDRRLAESHYQRGRRDMEKEMQKRWPSVFGEKPVYIPVASVQFLAPAPQMSAYEPPEKQTGPYRQINADELQRLFGTQSLPAIDAHGLLRKYNEHKRKAGE